MAMITDRSAHGFLRSYLRPSRVSFCAVAGSAVRDLVMRLLDWHEGGARQVWCRLHMTIAGRVARQTFDLKVLTGLEGSEHLYGQEPEITQLARYCRAPCIAARRQRRVIERRYSRAQPQHQTPERLQ